MNDISTCMHAVRFDADFGVADAIEAELDAAGLAVNIDYDYARKTAGFIFHLDSRTQAEARAAELGRMLESWTGKAAWPMTLYPVPEEDWSETWKQHFHAVRVSRRILVKPSWESVAVEPETLTIEIDPGMSFGTGRHFTTVSCLKFLDECVPVPNEGRFLDVGCGSGILSIAAVRLGYRRVTAFDNDPLAVRIARENFGRNALAVADGEEAATAPLSCRVLDLARKPMAGCYDTVVANMLAPILVEHATSIAGSVCRDPVGYLVLAGMLTDQYPEVKAVYEKLGFTEAHTATDGEWRSGCFKAVRSHPME